MSFSVPTHIQEEEAAIRTLRVMRHHERGESARTQLRDAVVKAIRNGGPERTSEFVVRVATDSGRLSLSYRITVLNKKTRVVDAWDWVGMMTLTKLYGRKLTATTAQKVADLITSDVLNGREHERFAMLGMDPGHQGPTVPPANVQLVSSDGQTFYVDHAVATVSRLINNTIEDTGLNEAITLPNVDGETLAKVIEYCNFKAAAANVEAMDATFMNNVDQTMLFKLIKAANFMDIRGLFNLACHTVADNITGKTPEQIRTQFGIENDFRGQEEAAVRAEYAWAFE